MARYVAFDVETPNRRNDRMSAIGITVMGDDGIEGSFYSLVNPETRFDAFNTRLTGICSDTVRDAPTFPQVWDSIGTMMSSGILVAHNAVFDLGVLKRCLQDYGVAWRDQMPYLCTVQMGRSLLPGMSHGLNALCDYYGIDLDHHHAGSDSNACALILTRYLEGGAVVDHHIRTYSFK